MTKQMALPDLEGKELGATQGALEHGLVMRAELGPDGMVRGTASTYGNADRMDRVLLPGAFGKTGKITVPFLLNHKDDMPLGQSVFTPTKDGLRHESDIVGDPVQPGTQVPIRKLLHSGYPATSIGWLPRKVYYGWSAFERAEPARAREAAAAGVVQGDHLRYFPEVELVENSLVPIPANPRALLEAASLLPTRERAHLEAIAILASEQAAGARHSTADQAHIQQAHDHLVSCGAECPQTPLEPGDTLDAADTPSGTGIGDSGVKGGWQKHMRSAVKGHEVAQATNELVATLDDVIDQALQALKSGNAEEALSQLQAADSTVDDLMEALNIPDPDEDEAALREVERSAAQSVAAIDDLPDSDFAYIEPGGKKDADGKTTPRSLRHFPIHDAAHVRNALGRAPQSPFGEKAMPAIRAAAKKFGIDVADDQSASLPVSAEFDEIERELAELAVRY